MKGGTPVRCGNLAEIYVALCQAMGVKARAVGLSVAVQNGLFGIDTHAAAEVWLRRLPRHRRHRHRSATLRAIAQNRAR